MLTQPTSAPEPTCEPRLLDQLRGRLRAKH